MKRLRLPILLVVTLFGNVYAQGFQAYTFADIRWLSAPEVVVSKLEGAGYTVPDPELDENNTITFSGPLLGNAAVGTASFGDERQLLKIDVMLAPGSGAVSLSEAEATYIQLRDTLFARYGVPSRESLTATGWFTENVGGYVGGILLEVGGDAAVTVAYESPRWTFYLAERRGEGTDAF